MDKFQCSQCGATDFNREGDDLLRCKHCESLFRMSAPPPAPSGGAHLVIGSHGHVVFGKNSHVVVHGSVQIEQGANVEFLGELEIVDRAPQAKIDQAREALRLLKR